MKLTLKSKKNDFNSLAEKSNQNNQNDQQNGVMFEIGKRCCGLSQGKRHQLIRAKNQEEKSLFDLIRYDCQVVYSRVYDSEMSCMRKQTEELYELIVDTIKTTHNSYNPTLGYLCAHVSRHSLGEEQKIHHIYSFLHSYRPILDRKDFKEALLQTTLQRFYAYLGDSEIDPNLLPLRQIGQRYQQSLLLQFIPVEYSEFMIQEYLKTSDPEQYIQLATSLVHFITNTKNPMNLEHCTQMMQNPFMGVVEWPIVIGHRKMFKKPELTESGSEN